MASYLGTEFQNTPVQSAINAPLIQTVLLMKQGQYDTVKSNTQQGLDQLGQIAVLRPQDQEYINQKISDLASQLNSMGTKNLADPSVSDKMYNAIRSTARDPFVLNAVEQTQKYKNYNLQVDEIKKKKRELYSDANYNYGLYKAGFESYINGETQKLGNLEYTPYTDLTKTHLDKLKVVKDLKGKRFIEERDNNGTIRRKEIDGMTNQEIQEYFNGILTPEEVNQLKINGWAKFRGNEREARADFEKYNQGLSNYYDGEIERLEAKSENTSIPQAERENAKRELEAKKTTKEIAQQNIKNRDVLNIDDIGLILEKASYTSSIANIASSEWNYEYKLDPIWKAKEDFKYQAEELALKKNKDRREEAEFLAKMAKEYKLDENGNPIVENRTSESPRRDALPEDVSGIVGLEEQSKEQFNIVVDTTRDLLNKLTGAQKKQFLAELKQRGVDENLNKIGTGRVIITDAIVEAFDAAGLSSYATYDKTIKTAAANKDAIASDIIKVKNKGYSENFAKDPDKYLESFISSVTDVSDIEGKNSKKLSNNIENFKQIYKEATGKDLNVKVDILGQGMPVGTTWSKIREELKKTLVSKPNLLVRVAETKGSDGKQLLKEDSKQSVENNLQRFSSEGAISTFTTYNNVNILNEKDKNDIIKMIPQDAIEGAMFNPKLGMSVRKLPGGKIELVQYQGEEKGIGGTKTQKYAKYEISKGGAVYDKLSEFIQLEQDKKTPKGFNANSFTTLKPKSPRLNVGAEINETNDKRVVNAVREQLQQNPNISRSFLNGDPRLWATARAIKTNLKAGLQDDLDNNTLETFANTFSSKINQFKLQPYTVDNPLTTELNDKVWGFKVINPNGKEIRDYLIGVKVLDAETKYLLESQPQVYITEAVYQGIKEDKDFLNVIFK